jgi:hypothetical protein
VLLPARPRSRIPTEDAEQIAVIASDRSDPMLLFAQVSLLAEAELKVRRDGNDSPTGINHCSGAPHPHT